MRRISRGLLIITIVIASLAIPVLAQKQGKLAVRENAFPQQRGTREQLMLIKAVRHELIMLPYYNVFDWLEFELKGESTVVLRGQVVRPTLKSDAERL